MKKHVTHTAPRSKICGTSVSIL